MIESFGEYIYFTVGADYQGNNNYVTSFNKKTNDIKIKYRTIESYAVEGIVIRDRKIFIINDGLFHDAIIPKTYISVYDLKE